MTRPPPGSTVMAVLAALLVVLVAAATWSALTGAGELALDLGPVGAGVAVLAVLVAVLRRPPGLDVGVVDSELRVRFHGWDVLGSLRHEVRIPVEQIRSVRVHRPQKLGPVGGTVASARWSRGPSRQGWFGGPDGRELWDVRAGAGVIDVRLAPPSPAARLVLQVPDPTALARNVTAAARDVRTQ